MRKNRKENKIIMDAIKFLEKAPYGKRKHYMKDYLHGNGVEINGYIFQKDVWDWLIWKPTDLGEQPQFKGEPLVKVVPTFIEIENIGKALDLQPWTYL